MPTAEQELKNLFFEYFNEAAEEIQRLPVSGGTRNYYRLRSNTGKTAIGTEGKNEKENQAFFYWSKLFSEKGINVPEILAKGDAGCYLQSDAGDESLLDVVRRDGFSEATIDLYKAALSSLARVQQINIAGVDFSQSAGSISFSREMILHDLLYFKFYFLDAAGLVYDKEKLLREFEALADKLSKPGKCGIMLRDFQGRNILIRANEPILIDYQAAMEGPPAYDAISLIWQASADMPMTLRNILLDHYLAEFPKEEAQKINLDYHVFLPLRLLQVLGAYGFLGLFQKKEHFLGSIVPALQNIRTYSELHPSGGEFPETDHVIRLITEDEFIARFETLKRDSNKSLTVHINSFSFLKRGYPAAIEAHGGGFVFDCRGILNPGRVDEYKQQTGRDKPVQDYLTGKTRMEEFLGNIYRVVDISVEDYLARGFAHLEVNFGCTGGQHRSVYAADALAKHLKHKFGVTTQVKHLEQNFEQL